SNLIGNVRGCPRSVSVISRASRWIRRPREPSDWKPTNKRAWSGLSAQPLKYSRTGPPDIMPEVARTMHGSTSSTMFARMSAVQVDRHLGNLAVPHRVLEDEHDLLGTADGEHGDQDLPASGQDAPEDFLQLLGGLVAGRLDVMIAAVRRLEDEGLQPRELVHRRVEEPGLLEFDIAGHGDVVQA